MGKRYQTADALKGDTENENKTETQEFRCLASVCVQKEQICTLQGEGESERRPVLRGGGGEIPCILEVCVCFP